jgi:NTE family protein
VIEWLTENGYEIRSIAGTSMGALIGGIYAADELDAFTRWVSALKQIDVMKLLDLSFASAGLFKGDRVIGALRELIGDRNIDDLPVSFTAVATDLRSGKEVWLTRGSLFDAIRASIAIPTIFTPHVINGRRMVDGGLVNPIPITPTFRDETDLTVAVNATGRARSSVPAVDLGPPPAPRKGEDGHRHRIVEFIAALAEKGTAKVADVSLFDVIAQSMATMQSRIARFQLAAEAPDVLVEIPRDACQLHEIHRARELIQLGRERVAAAFAGSPHRAQV